MTSVLTCCHCKRDCGIPGPEMNNGNGPTSSDISIVAGSFSVRVGSGVSPVVLAQVFVCGICAVELGEWMNPECVNDPEYSTWKTSSLEAMGVGP